MNYDIYLVSMSNSENSKFKFSHLGDRELFNVC